MRFMIILKGDPDQEAWAARGAVPDERIAAGMRRYHEELRQAGVLLAAEGLHPTSNGARVQFSGGKRTVIDGPFTEAKELIAGFYLIQAKSKEEAVEWASRVPVQEALWGDQVGEVEVRQVFDADCGPG